jgi:hypothetical protein
MAQYKALYEAVATGSPLQGLVLGLGERPLVGAMKSVTAGRLRHNIRISSFHGNIGGGPTVLPRPSCCGVPPWLTLACACFPKAVVLKPVQGISAGLRQRVPPTEIPRTGSVNDLGRRDEVGCGRAPPVSYHVNGIILRARNASGDSACRFAPAEYRGAESVFQKLNENQAPGKSSCK